MTSLNISWGAGYKMAISLFVLLSVHLLTIAIKVFLAHYYKLTVVVNIYWFLTVKKLT